MATGIKDEGNEHIAASINTTELVVEAIEPENGVVVAMADDSVLPERPRLDVLPNWLLPLLAFSLFLIFIITGVALFFSGRAIIIQSRRQG